MRKGGKEGGRKEGRESGREGEREGWTPQGMPLLGEREGEGIHWQQR